MHSSVNLSTNHSRLYMSIAADPPNGVEIKSPAPPFTKGFDLDVNVNIDIAIDLTKIAAATFSVWLVTKIASASPNRCIDVDLNGKHIPEDQTDAVKLITSEVENKAQNDSTDK